MWTKDPALQRTFPTAGTAALGWLHGTAHGKAGSPRRLCTMLGRFWHGRCCLCRRRHVIRDVLASAFEHFCYWWSRRKSHTGSWTPGPVSAELNARGMALSVASFPGVFVLPVLGCGVRERPWALLLASWETEAQTAWFGVYLMKFFAVYWKICLIISKVTI